MEAEKLKLQHALEQYDMKAKTAVEMNYTNLELKWIAKHKQCTAVSLLKNAVYDNFDAAVSDLKREGLWKKGCKQRLRNRRCVFSCRSCTFKLEICKVGKSWLVTYFANHDASCTVKDAQVFPYKINQLLPYIERMICQDPATSNPKIASNLADTRSQKLQMRIHWYQIKN